MTRKTLADRRAERDSMIEGPRTPVPGSGPQPPKFSVRDRSESDPRRGFASHRDFLEAVMKNSGARDVDAVRDERLRPLTLVGEDAGHEAMAFLLPAAWTPGNMLAVAGSDEQGEYDDRYGGFAVPEGPMLPGILQVGADEDPTIGRTLVVPMQSVIVPILARTDKDHNTSVSGGLVVTRRPETVAISGSRMQLERIDLKASALFGLTYASEELLQDAPGFVAIIASGFREQFAFHLLNEKLRGNGGMEYLGVLNSPAKIDIAPEVGQAAGSIVAENLINMRARCWGYENAIWLTNSDAYPQLSTCAVIVGDASGAGGLVMVYQDSMEEDRPDMLLGRPIFYSENCESVGTEGDIVLVNWSQYLEGVYQPFQGAESVHVRFVNHERTFKFWIRNAGAPWWRAPLQPANGANTRSPIVTLQTRS